MDYITNYYKNLSEQLQNKINILNNKKRSLMEGEGPILDYVDTNKFYDILLAFRRELERLYGPERARELYKLYEDDYIRIVDRIQKYGVGSGPTPQFVNRPGRNYGMEPPILPPDLPPPGTSKPPEGTK
ncbi:MAG: hypothetical protein H7831_10825 [Magnetococcus sp. WYHC-3]